MRTPPGSVLTGYNPLVMAADTGHVQICQAAQSQTPQDGLSSRLGPSGPARLAEANVNAAPVPVFAARCRTATVLILLYRCSRAVLLLFCRRSAVVLLPFCCRSVAVMLPLCCRSVVVLPSFCRRSSAVLSSLCCRSAAVLLPFCRGSAAVLPLPAVRRGARHFVAPIDQRTDGLFSQPSDTIAARSSECGAPSLRFDKVAGRQRRCPVTGQLLNAAPSRRCRRRRRRRAAAGARRFGRRCAATVSAVNAARCRGCRDAAAAATRGRR